jgi:hypothetical protein
LPALLLAKDGDEFPGDASTRPLLTLAASEVQAVRLTAALMAVIHSAKDRIRDFRSRRRNEDLHLGSRDYDEPAGSLRLLRHEPARGYR